MWGLFEKKTLSLNIWSDKLSIDNLFFEIDWVLTEIFYFGEISEISCAEFFLATFYL